MSAVMVNPGYRPRASLRPAEVVPEPEAHSGRLRLTRRGRVVFTTLASIPLVLWALVSVLSAGGAAADADGAAVGASLSYVIVDAGASLWEIAVAVDPSADPAGRDRRHRAAQRPRRRGDRAGAAPRSAERRLTSRETPAHVVVDSMDR